MTLREYVHVIRERWLLVVAGLLLGVLAATAVTLFSPKEYSSSAVLYVASQSTTDNTQAQYQGNLLSQQRVKSYTEMITSPRITGPAEAQAAAPGLGKHVTANAQPDTVLLTVDVTDTNPQRASAMANAVADVFSRSVAGLERPTVPGQPPAVSIQTFEPASPATAPSSPKTALNLALGAVLGLVLGLGAAFARHVTDTRIRSVEDVTKLADAPNLGAIAYDKNTADKPLILENEPHSPRAEAFRQVRTNLQFVDVEHHRKVIVVTSSLPGEGKSFSSCNLALTLKAAGTSVVLIEGDLRRPRVSEYFGLERAVGLTTVLTGRATLDEALQPWGGGDTLQVLTSGVLPPNPSELLGSRNMQEVLEELGRRFAVVIVDAPPLLPVTDAAAVGRHCDGAVVVVRHGETTRPQLQGALDALDGASVRVLGTIVNRVPTSGPRGYSQYGYYYAPDRDAAATSDASSFTVRSAESLHTVPMQARSARSRSAAPRRAAAGDGAIPRNGRRPASDPTGASGPTGTGTPAGRGAAGGNGPAAPRPTAPASSAPASSAPASSAPGSPAHGFAVPAGRPEDRPSYSGPANPPSGSGPAPWNSGSGSTPGRRPAPNGRAEAGPTGSGHGGAGEWAGPRGATITADESAPPPEENPRPSRGFLGRGR